MNEYGTDVPDWPGDPADHPLVVHLRNLDRDLVSMATKHRGMHPAIARAIGIAEWMTAYWDEQLPGNVRDFCYLAARDRTLERRMAREQEQRAMASVAAAAAASEYAARHMPDDASALVQDE